jgi:hypothetical protein
MSKSDRVTDALDDVLARLRQGEARERCLARHPDLTAELTPLIDAYAQLTAVPSAPTLPAARVASRRQQFLNTASQMQTEAVSRNPAQRLVGQILDVFNPRKEKPMLMILVARMAVAIIMLFGAFGGITLTANASLPDSPMYGIKLLIEDAQLNMAPTAVAKAELSITFASERAKEIVSLARADHAISDAVLTRLNVQTTDALHITSRTRDQDMTRLLEKMRAMLQLNEQTLEQTRERASEQAQDALRKAVQTMTQARLQAEAGLADPAGFQHGQEGTQPSQQPTPHGSATPGAQPSAMPNHTVTPHATALQNTPGPNGTPHSTARPEPSQTPGGGQPSVTSQPGNGPGPQTTPGSGAPNPTSQPTPNPGDGNGPTPQPTPGSGGHGQTPQPTSSPGDGNGPGPQSTPQPQPTSPPGNGGGGNGGGKP